MKSISQFTESKQTELFDKYGCFFAFSNEQFDKQKKEGTTYVSMGGGLLCPKENAEAFYNDFETMIDRATKEYFELYGAEKIIRYEYFNHEIQITGDIDE